MSKPGPPRRLILLRHGQTEYNNQGRMQGQLDTDLTETGVAQAKYVAERLAELEPRTIISSDLSRAARTAEEIGNRVGVPVRLDARLRETHLGHWQDLWHHEVDRDWPGHRPAWMADPTFTPPGGGESRVDVARRSLPVIDDLLADPTKWNAPIILVAHGGLISTLVCALLDLPIASWHCLGGLGNCAWAQLAGWDAAEPEEVRWQLQVWNATAETADSGVQ